MKIRSDYVSNSSSSSFIINFDDNGACMDDGFMRLLSHVEGIWLRGHCKSIEQMKELAERAKVVFSGESEPEVWADEDEMDIEVTVKSRNLMVENADGQIKFIKEIIDLENSGFYAQCGDDWGDDLCNAVQIATLIESKYKNVSIDGDDHFDYTSIRDTDLDI